MISRRLCALGTALLLSVVLVSACGDDSDDSGGSGDKTLTVYAAASLTKTFTDIGKEFESQHDGVKVEFSFGGSSDLVAQIQQGAPADVFASADEANMEKLTGDDLQADDQVDFASNTLEIATPPGNPAGITSFADLGKDGVNVVVCAPEVPCGAAAVKAASGEADAGLVYVTDVKGAGDSVEGVTFPESSTIVNTYPIVALKDSKNSDLARDFVDLVTSDTGRSILEEAGFAKP